MLKRVMALTLLACLVLVKPVKAEEVHRAWATAYCLSGTTATGTQTTEGRTLATKREYFGSAVMIWLDDGDGLIKPENYLTTLIAEDTGGKTVSSGSVLDIYISDYDRAKEFGSKRVLYVVIESEG